MKQVKMMVLEHCPHCKKAFQYLAELKQANSLYEQVAIEVIDEQKEEAKTVGYDYYYVPTFFVDEVKMHEGVPTKEAVEAVLAEALK